MRSRNELYVLLDADGCVYNKKYRVLLAHLIIKFGSDIQAVMVGGFDRENCKKLSEKLLSEVKQYDVQSVTGDLHSELSKKVTVSLPVSALDQDIRNCRIATSDQYRIRRQYMRWLDSIDPRVMDQIVTKANMKLLMHILKTVKRYDDVTKVVFMVGSNRQSKKDDDYNRSRQATGSFYRDLPVLKNAFAQFILSQGHQCEVTLNKFLLSDVYADKADGASYQEAVNPPKGYHYHARALFDTKKTTMIYAFSHHIAAIGDPAATKLVHFYDNKADILKSIHDLFGKHQVLFARSVRLQLNLYSGTNIEPFLELTGAEERDRAYRQSVKFMAELVGCYLGDIDRYSLDVALHLPVELFLEKRDSLPALPELKRSKALVVAEPEPEAANVVTSLGSAVEKGAETGLSSPYCYSRRGTLFDHSIEQEWADSGQNLPTKPQYIG